MNFGDDDRAKVLDQKLITNKLASKHLSKFLKKEIEQPSLTSDIVELLKLCLSEIENQEYAIKKTSKSVTS